MWEEARTERFQLLRDKELHGGITEAERAELALMIQEIETDEAVRLAPATDRVRSERIRVQSQNRSLNALVKRRERLAKRLERFLADSQAERQAIEAEMARIMAEVAPGIGTTR